MTQEQKYQSLLAPRSPLEFLFCCSHRKRLMNNFSHPLNESGAFYRTWDLFCTLREPEVQELLDESTQNLYSEFLSSFELLKWEPLDGEYSHIQQLADNNLSSLVEPAKKLSRNLFWLAWKHMPWAERFRIILYNMKHIKN